MVFLDYLISRFGMNEPILFCEIKYKNYSRAWINKELAKLCAEGKLVRFEQGVYYVPQNTALGRSKLNPRKVIEKKYIRDENGIKGFYSGATLLNITGLSTQVPNVMEIYTNEENSKIREIKVGSQTVILRRARTNIDESNVKVQSFLELMNYVSTSFINEERKSIIKKYIDESKITRSDISKYAASFPDKAFRTLVESGVIYNVTQ